jgi:hypothetical protein
MNEEDDFDLSEEELDSMANAIQDLDDIIDAYDEDELIEIPDEINEILSRAARIQAKFRMKRTKVKREFKKKVALKKKSNNAVLLKRARRLAIKAMKQKLAKKSINKMNFSDKVRVEKIIAKRKALIDRLARKMMPRVRNIEQSRLTHANYTK